MGVREMHRLVLGIVLVLAGVALAQSKRTGAMVFLNDTDVPIKVAAMSILNVRGERTDLNGAWTFKPGEKIALTIDGKPVVGHRLDFRVTTYEGSSKWNVAASGDKPGPCLVIVNAKLLAEHRKSPMLGGERLRRPTGQVVVSNTSGDRWTLTCRHYLDEHNVRRTVRAGAWAIDKDAVEKLADLGSPLRVGRFEFTLTTAEGSSEWYVEAADAEVPVVIDATVRRRHRAAIKEGLTESRPLGGVSEAVRKAARESIAAAVRKAEGAPRSPGEALTHGGSARRDRVMLEQLQVVLPGRAEAECRAIGAVLLRVCTGELRPKKGDMKSVVSALRRAGVSEPEEAAAFVMLFQE